MYVRKITAVIAVLTLFLCASCAGLEREVEEINLHYRNLPDDFLKFDLTATTEERCDMYSMVFSYNKDDKSYVSFLAPESLRDINAYFEKDDPTVRYSRDFLQVPGLYGSDITPCGAPYLLMNAWRNLAPYEYGYNDLFAGRNILIVYRENAVEYRTVFNRLNFDPISAEIYFNDKLIIEINYIPVNDQT